MGQASREQTPASLGHAARLRSQHYYDASRLAAAEYAGLMRYYDASRRTARRYAMTS